MNGFIYLLHFARPLGALDNPRGQAQHYVGYALDPAAREREHRSGHGAALTRAAVALGIDWTLFVLTAGDRALERWIKDRKAAPRLCPICGRSHPRGKLVLPGTARQLALPLDDADPFDLPGPASAGYDAYEHLIRRSWQQPRNWPDVAGDDGDLDLPY